ncbi:hypothetical protein BH23BAC1_BH23BAC1_51360 [soil metagenome]
MIVNVSSEGWEIIYQRAHGLLAVQLAHNWQDNLRPKHWIETLAAITEHDDGQEPFRGHQHLTAAGAPKDFTFLEFSLPQAKNVSETSRYKSRWVALLISKHMSFLYESKRGLDKELDIFLNLQIERQKKWLKELKVTTQQVEGAYNLLQWCDRCSLILCKNQIPEDEKALEVYIGPDQKNYFIKKKVNDAISVEPWPFQSDHFEVCVEYRILKKMVFDNDEELAQALDIATVELKIWKFEK